VIGATHAPVGPKSSRIKRAGRGGVVALGAKAGGMNTAYGAVEAGNFTPSKCVAKNSSGVVVTTGASKCCFKIPESLGCTKRASTTISGFAKAP
jgi:hypothetical protein